MRARRLALGVACVALACACSDDPDTAIIVIATADSAVVRQTESLRLRVRSGAGGDGGYEQIVDAGAISWPVETTIVPQGGDAQRTFWLELAALDVTGEPVVIARAVTGFVAGETRVLRIHLDIACRGVVGCGELQTCEDAVCVDARIDSRTLPRYGADAQVADAGSDGGPLPVDACTPVTSYVDDDGDGYGDPSRPTTACSIPAGHVTRVGDCDDACSDCGPAGVERCDGVHDENCDGTTDEGCACTADTTRACPAGTDTGECLAGTQTCVEGTWGPCTGRIDPVPEDCDGEDDDCDGRVDEGLRRDCGTDVGACALGYESCAMGAWGGCTATTPTPETCNAIDDDCDGLTDEMVGTMFYRDGDADGYGNPSVTMVGCTPPAGWVATAGDCNDACRACHPGGAEVCEGMLDENCSMGVDEGCGCVSGSTRACPGGVDTGECAPGTQACTAGAWGACSGRVDPAIETCNARDDDCDALVDESLVQGCGPPLEIGICRRGSQTCSAGSWSTCIGAVYPSAETCNGMDDDCDGTVDDGVTTTFYLDRDADGYGVAGSTRQACTLPAGYAVRAGDCDDTRATVSPSASETCNRIDDDCDLVIDDGFVCGVDAGPPDAGPFDAGPFDAGPLDAGPLDAGPFDAGPFDAGPSDAGPPDAGSGGG